jgi:hypothetical protein
VKSFVPTPVEVGREALTVIFGAFIAALIIGRFPSVKQWMKDQWSASP